MAGTLAGLGFLPVGMTQRGLDLCLPCFGQAVVAVISNSQFLERQGSTKSWPNKSPGPLAPGF